MPKTSPTKCAATEAYEEAGAEGKVHDICLGLFSYSKDLGDDLELPCVAMVYPMKVKRLLADYPEKSERKRKWFSLKKAAKRVSDPELPALIAAFDPRILR